MPGGPLIKRALSLVVLAGWLAGTGFLVWLLLVLPNQRLSQTWRDTPVEIPPGTTLDQLAARLREQKVIAHPRAFAFYMRVTGADARLRSGWVVVNPALSMREHLSRLAYGYPASEVAVSVPEGFTRFDLAARLERFGVARADALLAAIEDPALLERLGIAADSAEGYLFPSQYRFLQDSAPARVISRMVGTFRTRTAPLFEAHAREQVEARAGVRERADAGTPLAELTPHQLLILASIIEREARLPEERAAIAGVFVNRLFDPGFKPKRLQADPTVAYGCLIAGDRAPSCGEFDGRHVTPAMVRDPENPYSTYRHDGLPPGPICNPGLASLQAALTPERHEFFYFVAKGGGRHVFARTLDRHNDNIRPAIAPAP